SSTLGASRGVMVSSRSAVSPAMSAAMAAASSWRARRMTTSSAFSGFDMAPRPNPLNFPASTFILSAPRTPPPAAGPSTSLRANRAKLRNGKSADDRRGLRSPRRGTKTFEDPGTAERDRPDRRSTPARRPVRDRRIPRRQGSAGLDRRPHRRDRGQDRARPGHRRLEAVGRPGEVRRHGQRGRRGYRGQGSLSDRRRPRGRREVGQALHLLAAVARDDRQGGRRGGRGQHARRGQGLRHPEDRVGVSPAMDQGGWVASGYEAVRDGFLAGQAGDEGGAQLAVYRHGERVVDLWAGRDKVNDRPYGEDTITVIMSCTKGATAACVHILAERGLIDYEAPVTDYWPEFAQGGKGEARIWHP